MCPLPDDLSSAAYANAYERPIIAVEPPLYAATQADVAALKLAAAQVAALVETIRANPWGFDSTHIPVHADVEREFVVWAQQFDAAIAQARQSMEGWS